MKRFNTKFYQPLLLGLALSACSEGADRAAAGDEYQPEGMRQAVQDQASNVTRDEQGESSAYSSGEQGQPEAMPATVHRTITFTGDSTDLDNIAKQSLARMANALNAALETEVVVRTVDPNDVSAGEPSSRASQRIEAVQTFLKGQGVNITKVRADKYSSREFDSSQNSEDVQDGLEATSGLSELEDVRPADTSKQEVVITIVSSEPL